jgi:hypothetical protein
LASARGFEMALALPRRAPSRDDPGRRPWWRRASSPFPGESFQQAVQTLRAMTEAIGDEKGLIPLPAHEPTEGDEPDQGDDQPDPEAPDDNDDDPDENQDPAER